MSSDPTKSELFNLTVLDLPDQTELILNAKYHYLQGILAKIPRAERIKHLTQIASSSIEKYRDINDAFLFGILATETQISNECFQLLHSIMQDQWDILCSQTRYFTFSKFPLLKSDVKMRLLWLVDKLAALQARGAENLVLGLLRHIKGGDYSVDNVNLIQKLLLIFVNHKMWYNQQSQLIPFSIYSFLRIISGNGIDLGLRKELAIFCSSVLTEKLKECSVIGRDLIRVLQDVSRMSEFSTVWKLLYQKNSTDSSIESTQLYKILKIPSPKRFLACRLTPEMEFNLLFILDHVKYGGNHRKYYEWFATEYLKVSDPDNLIVDIIRYLIVAYHPPNSILASSSVQRWQIITWFLRQMKTNYSTANAKLALFYDWLFYDPAIDNIMNVEPAILIVAKSATANPKITCTMIEFLYLLKKEYLPAMSESMEKCIDKTMFDILSKRVISNLESILLSDQISEDIKKETKELFPCYMNLNSLKQSGSYNSSNDKKGSSSVNFMIDSIEKCLNDPNAEMFELTRNLVNSLGTISDRESEECEDALIRLIGKTFENFKGEDKVHESWANALRSAFLDPSIEKDISDKAIERISLLSLPEFDFETFLIAPISTSMSFSKSNSTINNVSMKSSSSSSSDDSVKDVDMNDGIENQIRFSKSSDSDTFYNNCFTQFYLELSESPNVINLLGVILEDTDPSQLFRLKNQLLIGSKNPLTSNWENLCKSLPITKEWDGYCQIFLWDLLLICLKQISDPLTAFKEVLQYLRFIHGNADNSEICNGIINLSMTFYPKSSNQINEYFNWLLVFLEEGGSQVIMTILIFYWRSNSRFFLQSLVRLDEEKAQKINHEQIKNTLISFSKFVSNLEENSPAKKSLLSCIETTIALMTK